MKIALSTNWCNRRIEDGLEIAEKALELGFDALELGFHTSIRQVPGFKKALDKIPVGSVHAFCPVPISAPHGHPELYTLASFDPEARAMARLQISRNIDFAADMGAKTVVLHAGRVYLGTFFNRSFSSETLRNVLENVKKDKNLSKYQKVLAKAMKIRNERGQSLLEIFKVEVAGLITLLQSRGVTLALENLPYLEGFPNESEMISLAHEFEGSPIKAWFDTGHHRVRYMHGWISDGFAEEVPNDEFSKIVRGIHLNDVVDYNDDHLPPGEGKVDFAALKTLACGVEHVVVEPNAGIKAESLLKGLAHIRGLW